MFLVWNLFKFKEIRKYGIGRIMTFDRGFRNKGQRSGGCFIVFFFKKKTSKKK
jgi:hypothetical protein